MFSSQAQVSELDYLHGGDDDAVIGIIVFIVVVVLFVNKRICCHVFELMSVCLGGKDFLMI